MGRVARVVAVGLAHHITQRGSRGQDVFFSPRDRQRYLEWLQEYAAHQNLRVWAYCLMDNHVHAVAVPEAPDSIARTLHALHTRYALRINSRFGWQGHLWQNRYYSCVLDDAHLWEAVRYIESNPVRAGMVRLAQTYPWSSAAAHCGLRSDSLLASDLPILDRVDDWSAWLQQGSDESAVTLLRRRTRDGLPCGTDRFVRQVGALVGQSLTRRPRGRPRKLADSLPSEHQ